jgi:hypothetical protein
MFNSVHPSLLNSPELRFVRGDVRSGVDERQNRPGHEVCILGSEDDDKDQIHDETARQSRWALGIGLTIFGF